MTLQHSIDIGEREVDLGLHVGGEGQDSGRVRRDGSADFPAALTGDLDDARGESDELRVVICVAGFFAAARGLDVGEGGYFWGTGCKM
jgi:hypothetical protein